ncbi:replication factor [Cooperia oncophora]
MRDICEKEGVKIDSSTLETLITLCEGDLRRSITYLQSVSCRENVTNDYVLNITGYVAEDNAHKLLTACHSSDSDRLLHALDDVYRAGYAGPSLINQIYDQLLDDDSLSDIDKAAIFEKMAVVEARLVDGSDEYIQLMDLVFCIQWYFTH